MLGILISAVLALIVGAAAGYTIFRYVIKGKYNEMIAAANKEAEVVKEKKLLEVKEKFLNKKAELEKEVQTRNQKIQQSENRLKQREISLNQRQEARLAVLHQEQNKKKPEEITQQEKDDVHNTEKAISDEKAKRNEIISGYAKNNNIDRKSVV